MIKVEKKGVLIDVSGPWGTGCLEGIRTALVIDGTYFLAGKPDRLVLCEKEIILEWNLKEIDGIVLSLRIAEGLSPGEVIIGGTVSNFSDKPIPLDFIYPFILRRDVGGRCILGNNIDYLKVLVMNDYAGGYITRVEDFQGDVRPVEYKIFDRITGIISHGLTELYLPNDKIALLMGFLDFSSQAGKFTIMHGDPFGRKEIMEISAELEHLKLIAPHESVLFSPLWMAIGNDPLELLERYADRLRDKMNIKLSQDVPSGWVSWYAYRVNLNEKIVLDNARVQVRTMRDLGGTLCHMDLGWNKENRPGDWLETDKRFPSGIPNLCQKLINKGLKVGIWSTPLLVSGKSRVVSEHPEWLMRDSSGVPISFGKWGWEPMEECYCLDPSIPEVQEYLRKVYETIRGWGITAFKLDFSAAFEPGLGNGPGPEALRKSPTYFNQNMSRIELCRKIYGIIRQAIRDAHMTVCNAPWQGVVGIADSIFLATDVGNLTDSESKDERPERRGWDYFRERTRQVFARYFFHGKVWWGNPDCFVAENDAPENHARARLQVVMLSGGQYKCSNQLPYWKKERMEMFLKGLPRYGIAARPIDLFESPYPSVLDLPVHTEWGDWHVVGLFNWESWSSRISVNLAKLRPKIRGKQIVWDFWEKRFLGIFSSSFSVKLPGESATLLCVRPLENHPILLATDMHFTMGAVEILECAWNEEKQRLSGVAYRKRGSKGTLFFYLPPGYKHRKSFKICKYPGSILTLKIHFKKDKEPFLLQF